MMIHIIKTKLKTLSSYAMAMMFAVMVVGQVAVPLTLAADGCTDGRSFMGFPTWDRGLKHSASCAVDLSGTNPGSVVTVVILNIIDMALHASALIATGFIIVAGFKYATANGDSGKIANAKDTILKAIVGLVIVIVAASAVGFIIGRIAG